MPDPKDEAAAQFHAECLRLCDEMDRRHAAMDRRIARGLILYAVAVIGCIALLICQLWGTPPGPP